MPPISPSRGRCSRAASSRERRCPSFSELLELPARCTACSDARALANFSLVTGTLIIVFAFAAEIAYRLDALEIWRLAPAGILEQLSLLAAYSWLIAIGIHYCRTQPVGAST
ncbi:hypothetical protein ACVWY0_002713 [Arthrobacter sp. UYNi723]